MFTQKNKQNQDGASREKKKLKVSTFVYAFLILLIVVAAAMSVLAYGTNTQIGNKIAAAVSRVVPFPAVIIGYTNVIPLGAVDSNLASVRRFYESQDFGRTGLRVDFSTPDGAKRLKIKEKEVLNKMVEDKVVTMLAVKRGITISQSDVDKAVSEQLAVYGSSPDAVSKKLMDMYGWTIDDFKTKVVLPSMYRDRLASAVAGELTSPEQAQQQIQAAKQELDSGADFASVAQKYSQGASAASGGEMGWVAKGQLIPALSDAIYGAADPGDSIIESPLGFHIVNIEEKKKDGDADVVRFRQIFVPKETFADWLNAQMSTMTFWVPLNGYYWDRSTNTVEFKDAAMKTFQQNEQANPNGDASMMF